jgi:hypothetical protein
VNKAEDLLTTGAINGFSRSSPLNAVTGFLSYSVSETEISRLLSDTSKGIE